MLGAIVGDIVGSIYEFDNRKSKDFPFFQDRCKFTDDTILTIATADAFMAFASMTGSMKWVLTGHVN